MSVTSKAAIAAGFATTLALTATANAAENEG
jgi:hypothetical protein